MLFFRSEEQVRDWCRDQGVPVRPRLSMDQLWELAVAWYATRLEPSGRRPQPAEIVAIFTRIGIYDPFWDPQANSF